jgi:hypothetical protein
MEGRTESFAPRGQNSPLGDNFAPMGEVKNGPQACRFGRLTVKIYSTYETSTHIIEQVKGLYFLLAEGARIAGQKRNLVWGPNLTRARS